MTDTRTRQPMPGDWQERKAAVEALLRNPESIPETLEIELYVYRDVLNAQERAR